MKKILIGSFVGAILLFGWQSLSWTVLGVHDKAYLYTPSQDALLSSISTTLKTEGQYLLPRLPDNSSHEEMEKMGKQMEGKPWAVVSYYQSYEFDMVMPIVRGFFIALVCVILVCWVIQRLGKRTFGAVFTTVLTFGMICFLFVWYNQHNWFHTSWNVITGELIDNLAGWGLCGAWLGWWYGRREIRR
jgi:hypothetical protein